MKPKSPISKLCEHLASMCVNPDMPCPSDSIDEPFKCPFFSRNPKCLHVSVEKWKRWIKKNILDDIKDVNAARVRGLEARIRYLTEERDMLEQELHDIKRGYGIEDGI